MAEAVARAQRRTHQIDATLRFERLLHSQPSPAVVPSGHWVVLVGGEWGGAMKQDEAKTRPGAWLGSHTSLQAIGRAFEALMPTVGRERIIVIAQLRETLDWLETACESEAACEKVTRCACRVSSDTLRHRVGRDEARLCGAHRTRRCRLRLPRRQPFHGPTRSRRRRCRRQREARRAGARDQRLHAAQLTWQRPPAATRKA